MDATPSPLPFYPKGSRASWWQFVGSVIGVVALIVTAYAIFAAKPGKPPLCLFYLAFFWGVWPPAWWWCEYFFIFPKYYTPEKFEAFKHGAQASLAIWAPIAVGLFAYASSDVFKEPVPPAKCFASK